MKKPVKKRTLPKYLFERGQRIWMRIKREDGQWKNTPTPYTVDQVDQATRYLRAAMKAVDAKAELQAKGDTSALTVRTFLERWLKDREARDIPAVVDERTRMRKYVYPFIGDLALEELRPKDVRNLIRTLRALKKENGQRKLAPRSVLHVYSTLHNAFRSAVIDELLVSNPIVVDPHELPKKIDGDSEWRSQATYTVREVERLISDPVIPLQRRVMYAMKALAGMRHGEAAAFAWRQRDTDAEPLYKLNIVRSYCSRTNKIKSTKTEETRAVPEHPTLTKILNVWKLEHWPRIYGRMPKDDDLIVPTLNMTPMDATDAGRAMQDDLAALGLRREAGKCRKRGGHDLRSWYKTRCIEDGADSLIIRRTTHAPPKDVDGGYERFSWEKVCTEVKKLKVSILDGKVLPLVTESLRAEKNAVARWLSMATPTGFESDAKGQFAAESPKVSDEESAASGQTRPYSPRKPVTDPRYIGKAMRMLEKAIRSGDLARALRITEEIGGAAVAPAAEARIPTRATGNASGR